MKQRQNIGILFFTMIVVMLGFGIIIPIMPFYIEQMGASAKDLGFLMAIFSIMQLIFAPIWGGLSDRFGRKPVLIIGILGNAIAMFLFGFSTSMWMMYLSRALAGILSSATLPTAMAYIGDSTDIKSRSGGMGIIGAAMGVGMVLGPGLGGWLAGIALPGMNGITSLSTPFFVAGLLSILAMLLVWIILPESLTADKRNAKTQIHSLQIKEMTRALAGPLGFLLFLSMLVNFGMASFEGIFGLYAKQRYSYNPAQVGTVLMLMGVISAVVQGVLTGPATRRWGDKAVIQASLIGSAAGFVVMLFANTSLQVLITVGIFMFSNSMLRPSISAMISRDAETGQGVAMGLNNSFMSLGRIIGPIWAGLLFDVNLSLPYISSAAVMAISYGLSLIWMANKRTASAQSPGEAGIN